MCDAVEDCCGAEWSYETGVGGVIWVDLTLTTEHEIGIRQTVDHAHSAGVEREGETIRRHVFTSSWSGCFIPLEIQLGRGREPALLTDQWLHTLTLICSL